MRASIAALFKTIHPVRGVWDHLRLSRLPGQCPEEGRRSLWRQAGGGARFRLHGRASAQGKRTSRALAEIPLVTTRNRQQPRWVSEAIPLLLSLSVHWWLHRFDKS
jgi:hypothetical protein